VEIHAERDQKNGSTAWYVCVTRGVYAIFVYCTGTVGQNEITGLQILLSILSAIEILLFFLPILRSIIPFFATVCHHIPLLFRIYSQFFIDVLQLCPFLTTLPPATCIFGWLHWNCMLARKVKRPPPPPHRSCFPTVVAAATVVGIMSSYYAATLLRLRLECRPLGRGSWVAGYWQIKCLSAQILYIKK